MVYCDVLFSKGTYSAGQDIEVKVGYRSGQDCRRLIDAPPELPGEIKFQNDGQGIFDSPGAADLIRGRVLI